MPTKPTSKKKVSPKKKVTKKTAARKKVTKKPTVKKKVVKKVAVKKPVEVVEVEEVMPEEEVEETPVDLSGIPEESEAVMDTPEEDPMDLDKEEVEDEPEEESAEDLDGAVILEQTEEDDEEPTELEEADQDEPDDELEDDISDIVDEEPANITQPKAKPSLRLYRRIAIGFVVITAILLIVVLVLSTIKASITVLPKTTSVNTEFIADVVLEPGSAGEIAGEIYTVTVEEAREFEVSSDGGTEVVGVADGTVTLYNTSATDQPLVATTRLLSEDGVLFRIEDAVTVPANGSVEANAYADEEGAEGDIEPSTFTIPGLNSARQQEIYAESTVAMTGGVQYINVLTEEELDAASLELNAALTAAAKLELADLLEGSFTGVVYEVEELSKMSDTVPGTETESFNVSMKVQVVGVFYDQDTLANIAEAKLFESMPQGFELVEIDKDSLVVDVERYDLEEGTANVRVMLDGDMIIAPTNNLLSKDELIGLTPQEVSERLIDEGVAIDVEIEFFPFFVKKVPRLKDHIDIQIKTQ